MGSGCIDRRFVSVAIFLDEWSTSRPGPCASVKSSLYPLYRRLNGPQSQSGLCGEEKVLALPRTTARSYTDRAVPTPERTGGRGAPFAVMIVMSVFLDLTVLNRTCSGFGRVH